VGGLVWFALTGAFFALGLESGREGVKVEG
jgi:hypothetical protein